MKFTENDLSHLKFLTRTLDLVKYPESKADELVARYKMFVWISQLEEKITKEVEEDKALASTKIITEQELKSPVKKMKKSKKAKGKK